MKRGRRLRTTMTAVLGTVMALAVPAVTRSARADDWPAGSQWQEAYFAAADGSILHADIFRPMGAGPSDDTPPVLIVTPYTGSGGTDGGDYGRPDPTRQGPAVLPYHRPFMEAAIAAGYSVIDVELGGFGASSGCPDYGGPNQQAEVKSAVEWAAQLPFARGKAAVYGGSYDGWTGIMALAVKPRGLAAVITASASINPYQNSYLNGIRYPSTQASFEDLYYGGRFASEPPSAFAKPQQQLNADPAKATDRRCVVTGAADAADDRPTTPYWRARDLLPAAAGSTVPVFWVHGFEDPVVRAHFDELYDTLRGPHVGYFAQFQHVPPSDSAFPIPDGYSYVHQAVAWLDHYLRGLPVTDPPTYVQEGATGGWRVLDQWPAHASRESLAVHPGAYIDAPGNKAERSSDVVNCAATGTATGPWCWPGATPGNGSWTFSTPATSTTTVAGQVDLTVDLVTSVPGAHLMALLYDIGPDGIATFMTEGGDLLRPLGAQQVTLHALPQYWELRPGHRLGLLLSGSDDAQVLPGVSGTSVQVVRGQLTVPVVANGTTVAGSKGPLITDRPTFAVDEATIDSNTTGPLAHPASRAG